MKKRESPASVDAGRAARARIWRPAGIGLLSALMLTLATPELIPIHCVLGAALGFVAGMVSARAAIQHDPSAAVRAGAVGGAIAGAVYGLPFMVAAAWRWFTLDAAEVARRIADMSPQQLDMARQANIDVTAYAYHSNQEVSYFFGYLLFAASVGWLFGALGGAWARRRSGGGIFSKR